MRLRQFFLFAVSALLLFIAVPGTAEARTETQILVRVRNGVDNPAKRLMSIVRNAKLRQATVAPLFSYRHFTKKEFADYAFVVRANEPMQKMLDSIQRDPSVLYAEPDAQVRAAFTPNDPNYSSQWHLQTIRTEEAWDFDTVAPTYGGDPSVIVAVLDTGAAFEDATVNSVTYAKAPDFASASFTAGYDFVNDDTHPNDDNGHGTHVTATIVEQTNNSISAAGIAFNSTLMPIKILNANGVGMISNVVRGIEYAVQHNANVINLSLGTFTPSQTLFESLQRAFNQNIIVVAAVGNDATGAIAYPAAYDGVLAVTSVGKNLALASYANRGKGVTIAAPGGDGGDFIWQETFSNLDTNHLPKDFTTFGVAGYQGTSQASPQVSSAAALLLARGVPASQIPTLLKTTASDLGDAGYDTQFGYGLLNIGAALRAVSNDTSLPTTTLTTFPLNPDGLGGYYKTRPSLTLTPLDGSDGSGIAKTYFHWDNEADAIYTDSITAPDGVHTLFYFSVDITGNTEIPKSAVFTVDATPPVISVQPPTPPPTKRRITIQGTVHDNTSGTKSLVINGSMVPVREDGTFTADVTLREGKNTLSLLVTDNAGASVTIPYSIRLVRKATLVIAPNDNNGPRIFLMDGTGKRLGQFFAFDKNFRGGISLTSGDIDGNGIEEIIAAPASGSPQIRIFASSGKILGQFFAFDKNFRGGLNIATADVDGNGVDEILAAPASAGGPHIRIFNSKGSVLGQFFAYTKDFKGGIRLASIDYDNNGTDEILSSSASSKALPIRMFTVEGKLSRQMTDFSAQGKGNIVLHVGDFEGDGSQRIIAIPQRDGNKFFIYDELSRLKRKIALPKAWETVARNFVLGDMQAAGQDTIILGRGDTSTQPIAILDAKGVIIKKFQPFGRNLAGGWSISVRYSP